MHTDLPRKRTENIDSGKAYVGKYDVHDFSISYLSTSSMGENNLRAVSP